MKIIIKAVAEITNTHFGDRQGERIAARSKVTFLLWLQWMWIRKSQSHQVPEFPQVHNPIQNEKRREL